MNFRSKFKSLFRKKTLEADMAEEMRLHLELQTERNLAAGMSPDEARYAARRQFGGVEQIKEIAREERGGVWLEQILRDLRFAVRSLGKSPGFTLVAALTLALGLGANTTFFSVLYGVVLQPLPFPDAGELIEIKNLGARLGNDGRISVGELRDYRERQRSLRGIGAYAQGRATLSLEQGAERVPMIRITADLLPLLGISPALGRGFHAAEESRGRDGVVILSHEFWQAGFGGSIDVLGRTVQVDGIEHTIIGVMPAGFSFSEWGTRLWKPLDLTPHGPGDRSDRFLSTLARVAPGTSLAQVQSDLARVARELLVDQPDAYPVAARWGLAATPLRESRFGHMLGALGLLMAAAAGVLLIACVNVAIMFLLRGVTRQREIMIRVALGAAKRDILRQLLVESVIVCSLGMVGGLALAFAGIKAIKLFPPGEIPRLQEVAINGPVAAFTAAVLVVVTLVVGLAPARSALKIKVTEGLAQDGRTSGGRAAVRLREALTVLEVALAVLLLVCGGLTVRSLHRLVHVDLGFATTQRFAFKTNLTPKAYPDAASANRFYERLTARLETLPGVLSVAAVSYLPLSNESDSTTVTLSAEGAASKGVAGEKPVARRVVRGPYFATMGLVLLQGRLFTDIDRAGSPRVAIVDDEFVRRLELVGTAVIGRQLRIGGESRTIVGVVRRVKHFGPRVESLPDVYLPQSQVNQRGMYTVVQTGISPAAIAPLVRAALADIDPAVPMYFSGTMEQRYDSALALPRFTASLIGAFSTLAVVLAGVGIFGVSAYSVGQRSREIAIRFALGSPRSHVVRLILGRVGWLAAIGGIIGIASALGVGRLMTSVLFGVDAADALTLVGAASAIGLTALVASIVPLRRALRVEPMVALRAG